MSTFLVGRETGLISGATKDRHVSISGLRGDRRTSEARRKGGRRSRAARGSLGEEAVLEGGEFRL